MKKKSNAGKVRLRFLNYQDIHRIYSLNKILANGQHPTPDSLMAVRKSEHLAAQIHNRLSMRPHD